VCASGASELLKQSWPARWGIWLRGWLGALALSGSEVSEVEKVRFMAYVSVACSAPNGTQVPSAQLAKWAAQTSSDSARIATAQAAFNSLLCRQPSDFRSISPEVMLDVSAVNAATQCQPGAGPVAAGGAATGPGSQVGGRGGVPGSGAAAPGPGAPAVCPSLDVSDAPAVQPLNGSGVALPSLPAVVSLTTSQGPTISYADVKGLGRYRGSRRVASGMAGCAPGFPDWGNAFPAGSMTAGGSAAGTVLADVQSWVQAHPALSLIGGLIAAGALAMAAQGGKRG
jgi:hypothetical protein